MRVEIGDILSGNSDIEGMNSLRDTYIYLGHFPRHIDNPNTIIEDFEYKCTIMKQELFEKEHENFLEYMRTLAMNT